MKSNILFYILLIIFVSCNKSPMVITLEAFRTITEYNDTTFNSTGYITPLNNGYIIADHANEFIAIVDQNMDNLEVIGKSGKGPDEYQLLPKSYIPLDQKVYMYDYNKSLYVYDLQNKVRSKIDIDSITKFIKYGFVYHKDDHLIFLTLPDQTYNFVSYRLSDGKITYFHTNPVLSKLRSQENRYTYTALLDNGIFVVVNYTDREGFMYTFSLLDEKINEKVQIPLNQEVLDILQMSPQAPAFDGICVWKNRVFIAYNSIGLVTTQVSASGQSNGWIFLDYPDKTEDHIILLNFCVTNENLIFFNQGSLRFYKNPFK